MKHVIIHLGPHKTGSTAIQKCLAEHTAKLSAFGISYCHDQETHRIALNLANEQYDVAKDRIRELSIRIERLDDKVVILSQEDFSGGLIGRTPRKQIYPKLTKNLRVLRRSLREHKVTFVFFIREEKAWMRSCYMQNLKYRTKFFSLENFIEHFGGPFSWRAKLEKPLETFGENLLLVEYSAEPNSGVASLLEAAGLSKPDAASFHSNADVNKSPDPTVVPALEHINRVSEFPQTAWFAKSLVLKEWSAKPPEKLTEPPSNWPPMVQLNGLTALPALSQRVQSRVHQSDAADILPDASDDISSFVFELLPKDVELTDRSRAQIEDQAEILKYHLRGKSHLAYLNALVISYLRRDTKHTPKAKALFHRIWENHGILLVNELPTRWLISTLQTFLDHGKSEAQRQIGTVGYFYANLLKIYEGERSLEGRDQEKHTTSPTPETKNKFRGLDRFNVGGTDLMLNTNALALEIALRDDVAGLILQEFLLRVKVSQNAFTRLDTARASMGINVEGFTDTWSFFEPPS